MDVAGAALLAFAWLLLRIPFYERCAVPLFWFDSYKYLDSAYEIWQGILPRFYNHSPLYALLLAATMASGYLATLLVQSLWSLVAAVVFVLAARRWSPWLVLPAALAMALNLLHPRLLMHETSLLSEAIYAPLLILGYGCLIWSLATQRRIWYALTGLSFGLAIAAHDAGLFLLVVAVLVAADACFRGWGWKAALALLLPLAALIGSLHAYNAATLGHGSTRGAFSLILATATWWQPSENFPQALNEYVWRTGASVQPEDRSTVERSWNVRTLRGIYSRYYRRHTVESPFLPLLTARIAADKGGGPVTYADLALPFRSIALHAIRSRPDLYVKFVCTQLHGFFLAPYGRREGGRRVSGESTLNRRAETAAEALDPVRLSVRLATVRRYDDVSSVFLPPLPPTASDRRFYAADMASLLAYYRRGPGPSIGFRPYDWPYLNVLGPAGHSPLWPLLFFASLALSAWVWLASRGTNTGAFVVLMLGLGRLGAGLLVSLVEVSLLRYSFSTEPLAVAAVLLLPMLWIAPAQARPARALP